MLHYNIHSLSDAKIYALKMDIVSNFDFICLTDTNLPHANVSSVELQWNLSTKDFLAKEIHL